MKNRHLLPLSLFVLLMLLSGTTKAAQNDSLVITKYTLYGDDEAYLNTGLVKFKDRYTFRIYYPKPSGTDSVTAYEHSFGDIGHKDSFKIVLKNAIGVFNDKKVVEHFAVSSKNIDREMGDFHTTAMKIIKAENKDHPTWNIGVGVNFDFLNPKVSFNNVIYGETKYINNGVLYNNSKKVDLGINVGGTYGTSLSQELATTGYTYDFVPLNDTQYNRVRKSYTAKQKVGFRQLSLYFESYLICKFGPKGKFKIGFGPHIELYNIISYKTFSDITYTDTTPYLTTVKSGSYIPNSVGGVSDSVGIDMNYGYYGIAMPIIITEDFLTARMKFVVGQVAGYEKRSTPDYPNVIRGNAFYYISMCLVEPKTKISIQGNVRGSFSGGKYGLPAPAPIYNVYLTKSFDLPTLFENILSLGK